MMKNKGIKITLGVVGLLAIILVAWGIGVSNTEKKTVRRGEAQQVVCEAYFDKMWKIRQQEAQIADEYKEAFAEIYPQLMEGRYSEGGDMMKWIQEHNPEFDTQLYAKLMASVEGERTGFFIEQTKLIDIDREHKTMRDIFPNNVIIGDRPDIGYLVDETTGEVLKTGIVIIKSLKTDNAYETGREDEVSLF